MNEANTTFASFVADGTTAPVAGNRIVLASTNLYHHLRLLKADRTPPILHSEHTTPSL